MRSVIIVIKNVCMYERLLLVVGPVFQCIIRFTYHSYLHFIAVRWARIIGDTSGRGSCNKPPIAGVKRLCFESGQTLPIIQRVSASRLSV